MHEKRGVMLRMAHSMAHSPKRGSAHAGHLRFQVVHHGREVGLLLVIGRGFGLEVLRTGPDINWPYPAITGRQFDALEPCLYETFAVHVSPA